MHVEDFNLHMGRQLSGGKTTVDTKQEEELSTGVIISRQNHLHCF